MFFNVCIHSRSFPFCTDWQESESSVNRELQVNWRWNEFKLQRSTYLVMVGCKLDLPFPTPLPENPGELVRRLSPYGWVWVWVEVTLWLWFANVHGTYKLITKLTHLHTHIFLHFSIPVVMRTFLLAWVFSSFSPHPYLNITLPNISCYFIIQVIKCLTFKKWSKVLR